MVSKEQGAKIHDAEVLRATAPDKKCNQLIAHDKQGHPQYCGQIVKLGTLCPACGKKVQ